MNPITPSTSISSLDRAGASNLTQSAPKKDSGFSNLVGQLVEQTNDYQVSSDQSIQDLVTGKTDNIQQVVLAVANAEMSFQLFMELRNKLIDSYNELMRMQF
ncbi:MAG: flagellar hook-basal body complex protein FliE [Planctomycetota bacterium]